MKKILLFVFLGVLFSCGNNTEITNTQESEQKTETIVKQTEKTEKQEEKTEKQEEKTEKQEEKKAPFVAKDMRELLQNKSFVTGKIWGYVHSVDEMTDEKILSAFLVPDNLKETTIFWEVGVIFALIRRNGENSAAFTVSNDSFKGGWHYHNWYEDLKVKIRIDDKPAKEYTFYYDIIQSSPDDSSVAYMFDDIEELVQELRWSKKMIVDLPLTYTSKGYYNFNTADMDF